MDLKLASWAWRELQKQAYGLVEELKVGWSFSGDFGWWQRTREKEHVNVSLPSGFGQSWQGLMDKWNRVRWVPPNILPGLAHCPLRVMAVHLSLQVGGASLLLLLLLFCPSSFSSFTWVALLVHRVGPSYGFGKTLSLRISLLWFRDSIQRYPTFDPKWTL